MKKLGVIFSLSFCCSRFRFLQCHFMVFLPVVQYNQLPHSWGVPICVPLGWSSMIADGVVGRVQIRKHTETHADTPSQSNLDDCYCTCTTTTDLWSQQQAYLCMQEHHQTLDYCRHTYTTDICDHNNKHICRIIKTLTATLVQQRIRVITTTSITYVCRIIIKPLTTATTALVQKQRSVITTRSHMQIHMPLSVSQYLWSMIIIFYCCCYYYYYTRMMHAASTCSWGVPTSINSCSLSLSLTSDDVFSDTETFSLFWHACWFCDFVSFINFLFPVFPTIAIWFSSVLRRHSNATDRTSPLVRQVRDLWLQPVGCSSCVCLREALQIGCILFLLPSFVVVMAMRQKHSPSSRTSWNSSCAREFSNFLFLSVLLLSGTLFLLPTRLLLVDAWTCKIVVISLISSKIERERSSRSIRTSSRRCSFTSFALTISPWRRARLKQIDCCFNRKDHLHLQLHVSVAGP